MSSILPAHLHTAPTSAHDAVTVRRTHGSHAGPFSEVRAARRQRGLQVAAVSTGIVSVTVAASAAIVLSLSA